MPDFYAQNGTFESPQLAIERQVFSLPHDKADFLLAKGIAPAVNCQLAALDCTYKQSARVSVQRRKKYSQV